MPILDIDEPNSLFIDGKGPHWHVVCGDTGKEITCVIRVDTDSGLLTRHITDANGYALLNSDQTETQKETIKGNFIIKPA